jgi:FtsP/CotA-like multicopper oxidase with cupredoxin domain
MRASLAASIAVACAPGPSEIAAPGLATDLDPAEGAVEVELVARASRVNVGDAEPELWTWVDGPSGATGMPGPTVEVRLGDLLTLHLRNELPEATTVHLHGLRLPAAMDGTMSSQMLVLPGEEFTYTVEVKDAMLAWYHPHFSAHRQVERGLYGAVLVHAADDPVVTAERVLVLDDLRLSEGAFDADWTVEDLRSGRQSDLVLVNGVPVGDLELRSVGRERWRLLNAANARVFDLSLGRPFTVLGTDGGALATPTTVDHLLVAPGERYDLLVEPEPNAVGALVDLGHDRGFGIAADPPRVLFDVVTGATVALPPWVPPVARAFMAVPKDATVREVVLGERAASDASPMYTINDELWPFNTPWTAAAGTVERWRITNTTDGEQPFHLHGTEFRVVSSAIDGWKDVALVAQGETLLLDVPLDEPGAWMFHTHLLEHAEYGMMGELHVVRRP